MDCSPPGSSVHGILQARTLEWVAIPSSGGSTCIHISGASQVALMVKNPPANAGDVGSVPGWGRSLGEGRGHPLQYSCLENSMDRGAWRATVHRGLKKSDTTEALSTQHTHISPPSLASLPPHPNPTPLFHSSRGPSQPRDQTQVSRTTGRVLTIWAPPPRDPLPTPLGHHKALSWAPRATQQLPPALYFAHGGVYVPWPSGGALIHSTLHSQQAEPVTLSTGCPECWGPFRRWPWKARGLPWWLRR